MSAPPPEFSRPIRLDAIGEAPRAVAIHADPAERAALARRFALVAIDRLEAAATLHREGRAVIAEGSLAATLVQSCVATGDPLPAQLAAPFRLRFEPAADAAAGEVELDEADCDIVAYEGGAIDLGEAVAETLALSLDPFPRAADADARLRDAGVLSEREAGPFAALAALRDKLGG